MIIKVPKNLVYRSNGNLAFDQLDNLACKGHVKLTNSPMRGNSKYLLKVVIDPINHK